MGDLITLNCPSCGGKLEVNADANILNCKHCGSEHLVRHEGGVISLEAFARCPKCSRNDRVEKVSAFLRGQGHEINPTKTQVVIYFNKYGSLTQQTIKVPKKTDELNGLAKLLTIDYKNYPLPQYKSVAREEKFINIGIILILFSIIFLFIILRQSFMNLEVVLFFILGLLGLVFGIFFFDLGKQKKKSILEENEKHEQGYDNAKLLWHYEYERIKQAYDNMYYCYRDDCVFILNKRTYAPVEEMMSYLYENVGF